MKRKTVKALLENGILQAYAEGKEIQYQSDSGTWVNSNNADFSSSPNRYRIKPTPQFKVGDLVRTGSGRIARVDSLLNSEGFFTIKYINSNQSYCWKVNDLTPVREVRTPLTFEQAVKLAAEKGFVLDNGRCSFVIQSLGDVAVSVLCKETGLTSTEKYECFCNSLTFLDGTPFANVTYENAHDLERA